MSYSNATSENRRASSISSHGSSANSIGIVKTYGRRRTLPELLATRQTHGKIGAFGRRAGVPTSLMAYRGAWNPSRLQNMILAVGPGTPASVIMKPSMPSAPSTSSSVSSSSPSSSSSSLHSSSQSGAAANDNEEENRMQEDNDENSTGPQRRGRWTRRQREESQQDESDSDEEDNAQVIVERALMGLYGDGESDSEADGSGMEAHTSSTSPAPSMRHGGCINTAAWLDCRWRISTAGVSSQAHPSDDCPTQLVTSGDDNLVKFWDVRDAVGSTAPLPGGFSTLCPFSAPECLHQEETKKSWKQHYSKRKTKRVAGTVFPLATLHTGHRGNVFHVTPMRGKPGKVATCGADGFLRICDLESGESSVVISPEYDDELAGMLPVGLLSLRSRMCFSHHFLNEHTGLLCSQRGLRRFDLRLPPREQPTRSLLGGPFRTCKACTVWSSPESASSLEEGDSAYVFAGGSSADVALCDLRMADGSSNSVVQRYRPSTLLSSDNVSVSGLDLSRDKQELLVSYESDQIYTFPVFPTIKSRAGPTLDEIRDLGSREEGKGVEVLNELAAYGGHLNRFTFLKNAKYAGPRDEFICTGSDSGHAWIYEKATGSVVSFLNADHSTCNGVIPHPSLPFFITYGIDSTAKLWRASNPVDPEVDDSHKGRLRCYRQSKYEMSPTVRKWGEVQKILKILGSEQECEDTDILPDNIPSTKVVIERGMFGLRSGMRSGEVPRIANDLHNLPDILKHNLYACIRSLVDGDDVPVESDIDRLKHRISLIRLRHQADRLGLRWNPSIPWIMEKRQNGEGDEEEDFHPADLIPDSPSDWVPYDPEMCKSPWDFKDYFNTKEYGSFYRERYSNLDDIEPVTRAQIYIQAPKSYMATDDEKNQCTDSENSGIKESGKERSCFMTDSTVPSTSKMATSSFEDDDDDEDKEETKYTDGVYNLLFETMSTLKDAGNKALQAKQYNLAARRYDKAIQYGAVASMSFPAGNLDFAKGRKKKLRENGDFHREWSPLLRVLVISRLNLALLMLKPHFYHPNYAAEQARLALKELKPFCTRKGRIMKGSKLDVVYSDAEPEETYLEAIALQAKGYFRLGSAHYEVGEYSDAILYFEFSVKSTQLANSKPDNLVLKRLSQAKRENRRKTKRQKRFDLALSDDADNKDEESEES